MGSAQRSTAPHLLPGSPEWPLHRCRLLGGEGAVVSPEDQVEGHGLFALVHALAPVDVEQLTSLSRTVAPSGWRTPGLHGDLLAQTTAMSRVTAGNLGRGTYWGSAPLAGTGRQRTARRSRDPRPHHSSEPPGDGSGRIRPPHGCHQDGRSGRGGRRGCRRTPQRRRQRADGFRMDWTAPFQDEEVHSVAIGAHGEHLGLVSHAVLPLEIDAAQLIQAGGLVADSCSSGSGFQHGGQGGGAHDGGVLAQRVQDLEGLAAGIVLAQRILS